MSASRRQGLIKRDQDSFGCLSECEEPCIRPDFRRCSSCCSLFTQALLDTRGLRKEGDAVVFIKAVIDPPRGRHGQRFAIHHRSSGYEAEQTELREAGKSNEPILALPPPNRERAMLVFRRCQGKPDVDIREAQ